MTYKTHTAFALALSFSPLLTKETSKVFESISIENIPLIVALIAIFSLMPDLDEPNSYLSRKFPWNIISFFLAKVTTHRGVTHRFLATFFAPLFVIGIIFLFNIGYKWSFLAIFVWIAYLSHLIGDGFTIGGLKRFFYPFSKKTIWFLPKFLRFRTGSSTESIYLSVFTIILFIEVHNYYNYFIK